MQKTEHDLTSQLQTLQENFESHPSEEVRQEILNTEQKLIDYREKKINGIMARAKARWEAEGEKCTNYFCNLEKRHYNEKLISKIITENGDEILDQFKILDEQRSFYEKLYSSSDPILGEEHESLFFDENNPFVNKLTEDQKIEAEGELSRGECLAVLKNMKNSKSPGLDGYTSEFYKFFWNDISEFLIKSFNYSLEKGAFSTSQKQGLITCIPKEGKSKFSLKNWRPITLLNVDIKIASAALANRIKPLLKSIISETQQGFMKGRYIGECTRLISDLLEKVEEEDIPALLLLIDFEKAFDTLEWSFIDRALIFLGFGPVFCKWVKALYNNSQSCIINNGHCSSFFDVKRGVRQGDPLSPYLFILSLELMSAAIKNDTNINGIKINNSEYILSQYADDSSLLLDGNEESLDRSLFVLQKFSECAGLRANIDKTEAIWIGSKKGSKEKILPHRNLNWNTSGKFKLLGIKFDLNSDNKTLSNFEEKIEKIESLLNSWIYRDLTLIGKITVVKSLALPIIIQSLTVLPTPPDHIINRLQLIFFKFLWNGKPDKIKRNVLINLYEKGGLKMPHVLSFCYALKMSWINKLLDPLNISPWKTLFIEEYEKLGSDNLWLMPRHCIERILPHFNVFWKDIFFIWSRLCEESTETANGILSQPIWFNKNLKINNSTVYYPTWIQAGIFFINDLLGENNNFLTLEEFQNSYHLNVNFLQVYSIYSMIPQTWKNIILQSPKLTSITNDNLDYIKSHKKSSQFFYKQFLKMFSEEPLKQQEKWSIEMNIEIDNWEQVYQIPHLCTKSSKYISFQYKILNRILSTNNYLMKCKLKETSLCTFCNETKETIIHLFWDCSQIRSLWLEFADFIYSTCNLRLNVSARNIILGCETESALVNLLIILIKYYIYSSRLNGSIPNMNGIKNMIRNSYKTERLSAIFYKTPAVVEKIDSKWHPLRDVVQ